MSQFLNERGRYLEILAQRGVTLQCLGFLLESSEARLCGVSVRGLEGGERGREGCQRIGESVCVTEWFRGCVIRYITGCVIGYI